MEKRGLYSLKQGGCVCQGLKTVAMYAGNFSFEIVRYMCLLLEMSTVLQGVVNAFIIEVFMTHIISSPLGHFVDANKRIYFLT
jgi:hypothetical protein